ARQPAAPARPAARPFPARCGYFGPPIGLVFVPPALFSAGVPKCVGNAALLRLLKGGCRSTIFPMMAAGLRLYRHPLLCFASPPCGRGRPQGGGGNGAQFPETDTPAALTPALSRKRERGLTPRGS